MHTQTYTIHTTHSEPTPLEFNQAIESATTPIEHGTQSLISSLRRVALSLHFSVIEHEIFLAKKNGTTEYSKQNYLFSPENNLSLE